MLKNKLQIGIELIWNILILDTYLIPVIQVEK